MCRWPQELGRPVPPARAVVLPSAPAPVWDLAGRKGGSYVVLSVGFPRAWECYGLVSVGHSCTVNPWWKLQEVVIQRVSGRESAHSLSSERKEPEGEKRLRWRTRCPDGFPSRCPRRLGCPRKTKTLSLNYRRAGMAEWVMLSPQASSVREEKRDPRVSCALQECGRAMGASIYPWGWGWFA